MTAVPVGDVDLERIRSVVEEQGVVRLAELTDRTGTDRAGLYGPLMRLVESGEVAIFPIGESVQIRSES